jgi:[methyl-Co(III) methanol-specific corrinoid protein]:coenzyme M methyltransferase
MTDLIIDPSFIKKVLVLAEHWATAFIKEAIEAGADAIVLEDTWASGEILSQKQYQDFAFPGERTLARAVHEMGARSILQQCGCPKGNLGLMAQSGADGVTLHQAVDVIEAKKVLSSHCAAIGNLDPRSLAIIDPRDVRALSTHCLDQGIDVLAPACGLDPATPLGNLKAMAEAAQRFRR